MCRSEGGLFGRKLSGSLRRWVERSSGSEDVRLTWVCPFVFRESGDEDTLVSTYTHKKRKIATSKDA
jgi:hypothetical protein